MYLHITIYIYSRYTRYRTMFAYTYTNIYIYVYIYKHMRTHLEKDISEECFRLVEI